MAAGAASLASARKAVQVLTAIDDDEALHALARLARTQKLDARLRRAALTSVCKHQSPIAAEVLQELAKSHGPLAEEARSELKKRPSNPLSADAKAR